MSKAHPPTVIQALASQAVLARQQDLPPAALRAAETAFLDWTGLTLAGSREPLPAALASASASRDGQCRLVGGNRKAMAALAALVNGTAAHTLELDDIYSPGLIHPGAPVIAAALAACESAGATGAEFLKAIVIGYEVGDRVATDLGPAHYRHFHTTGTAGAIAAAAAAGTGLGLDSGQMAAALSMAATMAAGLQQTFRSSATAKPLHAGHAAQSGIVAATAAAAGAGGAPDILEGEAGMGAAMGGVASWEASLGRFGDSYLIEQTTVKSYPCCGHAFAAIDGALELLGRGVTASDVALVQVFTYAAAITVAGIENPQTSAEARFSIPYLVAAALADGQVTLDSFAPPKLSRAAVRDVMDRITTRADSEFSRRFPGMRGARVAVTLHSGEQLEATVPDRSGSPGNPVSQDRIVQKFKALAEPVMGSEWADLAIGTLREIGSLDDVRRLP